MKTIAIHSLRNYSLSNLNRGEDGEPKNFFFGDSKRQYISSQCLNKAMQIEISRRHLGDDVAINTKSIAQYIKKNFPDKTFEDNKNFNLMCEYFKNFGVKSKKPGKSEVKPETTNTEDGLFKVDVEPDVVEPNSIVAIDEKSKCIVRTRKSVIDGTISYIKKLIDDGYTVGDIFESNDKKKKPSNSSPTIDILSYMDGLDKTIALTSYELATGRMSTDSDYFETRESASCVSSSIGITKYSPCVDYFTAVDDFSIDQGSAMIGNKYLSSSAFYGYFVLDIDQVLENDEDVTGEHRNSIDSLVDKIMEILDVRLTCNPSGMQHSACSVSRPYMILAELFDFAQSTSYSDAFCKAIAKNDDPIERGIERLTTYVNDYNDRYDDINSTKLWMASSTEGQYDIVGATKFQKYTEFLNAIRNEIKEYITSKY